ncbi:hypothetical protein K438DRAFT_1971662 [Mycena galopus ATCC 62051]|nr:hypothetical protein K438DRAFT_1971662 [Mycena galopus ATCC 62051]
MLFKFTILPLLISLAGTVVAAPQYGFPGAQKGVETRENIFEEIVDAILDSKREEPTVERRENIFEKIAAIFDSKREEPAVERRESVLEKILDAISGVVNQLDPSA